MKLALDADGGPVGLFKSEREIRYFEEEKEGAQLAPLPHQGEIVRL